MNREQPALSNQEDRAEDHEHRKAPIIFPTPTTMKPRKSSNETPLAESAWKNDCDFLEGNAHFSNKKILFGVGTIAEMRFSRAKQHCGSPHFSSAGKIWNSDGLRINPRTKIPEKANDKGRMLNDVRAKQNQSSCAVCQCPNAAENRTPTQGAKFRKIGVFRTPSHPLAQFHWRSSRPWSFCNLPLLSVLFSKISSRFWKKTGAIGKYGKYTCVFHEENTYFPAAKAFCAPLENSNPLFSRAKSIAAENLPGNFGKLGRLRSIPASGKWCIFTPNAY